MQLLTDRIIAVRGLITQKVVVYTLMLVLLIVLSVAGAKGIYRYENAHPATYPPRVHLTIDDLTKNSSGLLPVEVFGKNATLSFPRPSQDFFHGGLDSIKAHGPVSYTRRLFIIFVLSLIALFLKNKKLKSLFCAGLLVYIAISAVWFSFRLSVGQDEFFTNLKHSQSWVEAGKFSLNQFSRIEGTVDFIPYFAAGILGHLGLPLEESLFCILLVGNIALIFLIFFWALRLTQAADFSLILAAFIGLLPNVLYMGVTGFTSVLFSLVILWAIYLYNYVPSHKRLSLILLGSLTLFRTEGALLAGLIWVSGFFATFKRSLNSSHQEKIFSKQLFKSLLVESCWVLGPFVVSCVIRKIYFGYWVPLPIPFKATGGDIHYLVKGLDQLTQVIRDTNFDRLAVVALLPLVIAHVHFLKEKRVLPTLLILTFFSLIYFSAGGDWLPPYKWNRYAMPFTLYLYFMSGACAYLLSQRLLGRYHRVILYPLLLIAFAAWYAPGSALAKLSFLPPRPTVFSALHADIEEMGINYWSRIDRLASFGHLLRLTTPKTAVIACPEVSTIMYFAHRDVLDMLGVANPDIAFSKLDTLNYDLAQRKRAPQTIEKHHPEIIAIDEPVDEAVINFNSNLLPFAVDLLKKNHFNRESGVFDTAYYRVGSFRYLEGMGYRHVLILLPNIYFNYFVSAELYATHLNLLQSLGITPIGKIELPYAYSPAIMTHFSEDGK